MRHRLGAVWKAALAAGLVLVIGAGCLPASSLAAPGSKPATLQFDGSAATYLGPLDLSKVGPRQLTRWAGRPTSTKRPGGGATCVVRWKRLGLTVFFVQSNPGLGACAPTADVGKVIVKGKRARRLFRTSHGLTVGDPAGQVRRRHKGARRHSKRAWWLRSAYSPVLGKRFGILVALVARGRVVGFVARAEGAAPAVGDLEGGLWQGPVAGDSSNYSVIMALQPGPAAPGQRVGSTDYPELHCGGPLTFVSRSPTEIRLMETIVYGKGRCVDTGIVTMRALPWGGAWSYEGTSSDSTGRTPTAALARRSTPVDVSDRIDPTEAGEWTGPVHGDSSEYDVEMDLGSAGPAAPGQVRGSQDYPELECGGTLTYIGRTFLTLVMREDITYGRDNCVNQGETTFRTAWGQWNYSGVNFLEAKLTRE